MSLAEMLVAIRKFSLLPCKLNLSFLDSEGHQEGAGDIVGNYFHELSLVKEVIVRAFPDNDSLKILSFTIPLLKKSIKKALMELVETLMEFTDICTIDTLALSNIIAWKLC